jgi:hypothetical protein
MKEQLSIIIMIAAVVGNILTVGVFFGILKADIRRIMGALFAADTRPNFVARTDCHDCRQEICGEIRGVKVMISSLSDEMRAARDRRDTLDRETHTKIFERLDRHEKHIAVIESSANE